MIDKTRNHFSSLLDYENLFMDLASSDQFPKDKRLDIKVKPIDYLTATRLSASTESPLAIIIGDYVMRLHC